MTRRTTLHTSIAAAAVAAVLGGCIQVNDADPVARALPHADDIKVQLPEAEIETAALGQLADYYVITRQVTREFNSGAGFVLVLLHTIVQFPATETRDNTYVWGPHSDALDPAEWRLTVTALDDGTYDYVFDGRSKTEQGAEFVALISGHAVPGLNPHRGSGNFLIDFDAMYAVDPIDNPDAKGTVEVTYDLENRDNTAATLELDINTRALDENGAEQPVVGNYAYAENNDGSGDFAFSFTGDIDDEEGAFEDAIIRSRWLADGAGRADVRISGGDLGTLSVTASECWDTRFRRTFYSDSQTWLPTEGDAVDCVFVDPDLP